MGFQVKGFMSGAYCKGEEFRVKGVGCRVYGYFPTVYNEKFTIKCVWYWFYGFGPRL